uniref:Guided entry of tail-anchored proteins factor 1 n=4 Tax=Laurasiatheria TaxID=314145 RepID=A0A8B9X724_BOSMU
MKEPEEEGYGSQECQEIRRKDGPASRSAAQCAGAAAPLCGSQFSMRTRGRRRGPHGAALADPATPLASEMSAAEADRWAWLLVLSFVFGCNVLRILLPSFSFFDPHSSSSVWHHLAATAIWSLGHWRSWQMSRVLQKDAEQESQMRAEIQGMKQELSTVNMMDEFARYARLERKINKMTDKLKTHVKARTAQLAKIKWVISVAFYILQAALMVSLIWKYYSVPVAVVPSKWITPLDRLVAFPTRVAGGVGITCWILVCNKVVAIVLHPFS